MKLQSRWTETRLKYLCRIVGGGTPAKENLEFWNGYIPWVSPKDMGAFYVSDAEDHITTEAVAASATQIVPKGSVIVVVRSGILRHTIPVAVTTRHVAINQDMKALIAHGQIMPEYLAFLIVANQDRFLGQWRREGTTVESIEMELLANCPCPTPPAHEQHCIVELLSREIPKIDDLIAKKQRLIDLLEEKRVAQINRAVTQGINPSAAMKDSQIDWLGNVPDHWNVAPLYARFEVQLGKMLDARAITGECLAPYLRNIDVQWDRVDVSNLPTMDFDAQDRNRFRLLVGDLLVCEGGESGRSAIWQGELAECYYQKALHRLRPRRKDLARFLMYALQVAVNIGVFRAGSNQNTIDHLTADKLRRHRFAFPPAAEQAGIVAHLDNYKAKHLSATEALQETITRLREYRAALITAAVTGQLDLRKHEKQMEAIA